MATRTSGRIIIPKNAAEMLSLAQKVYDKHVADGATSPLNAQQDYSWNVEGPKIAACLANHEAAEAAMKKAEELYAQRDIDLPSVKAILQNSGQVLKSAFAKNPKKLGEYGFTVDDSKQVKTPKEPK